MLTRASAGVLCGGVMIAAAAAYRVGTDLSESGFFFDHYDSSVGGSGIAATIFALLASRRPGWARVPLACAIFVAAFMAYIRFSPPDPMDNAIDLTPMYFPPVIFLCGLIALLLTATASEQERSGK